jgi:hypothetical protein
MRIAGYSMPSRWIFDVVSGYSQQQPIPPGSNMSLEELRKGKYVLDEKQWMTVRPAVLVIESDPMIFSHF